ncbi:MAG: hypothetical protein WDZ51_10440 [Pirellulaceae bacterium]
MPGNRYERRDLPLGQVRPEFGDVVTHSAAGTPRTPPGAKPVALDAIPRIVGPLTQKLRTPTYPLKPG